jgi:hypothetical protein
MSEIKLRLVNLENVGDAGNERVVLRAAEDLNLNKYAVFRCRITKDGYPAAKGFSGGYWFIGKDVKASDFVIIYTKIGTEGEKSSEDGKFTSHFFYWGISTPIWPGHIAAVAETSSWQFLPTSAPVP